MELSNSRRNAGTGHDRTRRRWPAPLSIVLALVTIVGAAATDVLISACGGYTSGPTTEPPPVRAVTVTILASGVTPRDVTGTRATLQFVNNDTEAHDIRSNPHPAHSDCPTLNVGVIQAGQRVAIFDLFDSGTSCGYHDDTRPDDPRFQGSIVIQ